MAYWLFKSEPNVFCWEDLAARGKTGEEWTGVRNYQARNNMRAMKFGEKGFLYYSNEGKAIVGTVEVCKLAHRDSTSDVDTWDCVDIRALAKAPKPVTLDQIKADRKLSAMVLVTNSRLSVQPVTAAEWAHISGLAGLPA